MRRARLPTCAARWTRSPHRGATTGTTCAGMMATATLTCARRCSGRRSVSRSSAGGWRWGPGGTLALYAYRGVEVHLACATRGEVGTVSEELLHGYADIGSLREHEL